MGKRNTVSDSIGALIANFLYNYNPKMTSHFTSNKYSTRSQMMIILLASLHTKSGGNRKLDVTQSILDNNWFDKQLEDIKPMPSSLSKEPRWITSFAFARKDCVEEEFFIDDGIEDSWQISKLGHNTFVELRKECHEGDIDVRKCYMWSETFKSYMDPKYTSSESDSKRPDDIYKDYSKARFIDSLSDMF